MHRYEYHTLARSVESCHVDDDVVDIVDVGDDDDVDDVVDDVDQTLQLSRRYIYRFII